MATSSGLFLATIYNQSQLAERKHVARYWSINTAATAVPLSAHLSSLVITYWVGGCSEEVFCWPSTAPVDVTCEYVRVHCLLGGEQADDISFQRSRVGADKRQCSSETAAGPVSDHVACFLPAYLTLYCIYGIMFHLLSLSRH